MLEESVASTASLWATVHSWFSPAVLFILLNVMIGTIAITSSLTSSKTPEREGENPHNQTHQNTNHTSKPQSLTKSPTMLQRLKSFNFYPKPQEPTTPLYEQNPEINHLFSFPESHEHGGEHEHVHAHVQYQQLGETQEVELEQEKDKPFSPRSPSIMEKIKSFRLRSPISPEPTYPTLDPDQEQEEEEEEEQNELEEEEEEGGGGGGEGQSTDGEVYIQGQNALARAKSDTKPASGETLPKLSKKMRRSASEKSAFAHFGEEHDNVENRRPANAKEGKSKGSDVDEEVDAKADDFINRFKHQLKLQRIDSFIRYKEMINRESAK